MKFDEQLGEKYKNKCLHWRRDGQNSATAPFVSNSQTVKEKAKNSESMGACMLMLFHLLHSYNGTQMHLLQLVLEKFLSAEDMNWCQENRFCSSDKVSLLTSIPTSTPEHSSMLIGTGFSFTPVLRFSFGLLWGQGQFANLQPQIWVSVLSGTCLFLEFYCDVWIAFIRKFQIKWISDES